MEQLRGWVNHEIELVLRRPDMSGDDVFRMSGILMKLDERTLTMKDTEDGEAVVVFLAAVESVRLAKQR